MIVVSDNRGDRVEVGETRAELEHYLDETCDDDYARTVMDWFNSGQEEPLLLENGLEDVTDTWEVVHVEDDEDDQSVYFEFTEAAEDSGWDEEEEESREDASV